MRTGPFKTQYGIGAIGVVIDHLCGGMQRAIVGADPGAQPGQRVGRDVIVLAPEFAPGDFTIAVGVQADGIFQVAQCNVPLPGDFRAIDHDAEIAVAGFVCECGSQREQGKQQSDGHLCQPSMP